MAAASVVGLRARVCRVPIGLQRAHLASTSRGGDSDEYRGPGGLTASEIFGKVRESVRRDDASRWAGMSVAQLRSLLLERGVPESKLRTAVEKADLVEMARALHADGGRSHPPRST